MKKYSASASMHIATSVTVRSEVISLTGVTPSDDLPPDKQARCSVSKRPTNIDALGQAWGGQMRYQPNGWYAKSQWAVLVEEAIAGENSITRIAFDSSYGDAPLSSSTGNNIGGGQKFIAAHYRSTPLIKRFMPANIIPYHIAWKERLPLSYQAILWVHYVPIVEHTEKLQLLDVTGNTYKSWVASAQRRIDQEICELREPAPEPPEPTPVSGPLWPCRILGRIHKASAESSWPECQFPRSPLFDGFRMSIGEDENENYIFRLSGGEIYAILAKRDYKRFLPDEAKEFLDFAFDNMTLEKCDRQA